MADEPVDELARQRLPNELNRAFAQMAEVDDSPADDGIPWVSPTRPTRWQRFKEWLFGWRWRRQFRRWSASADPTPFAVNRSDMAPVDWRPTGDDDHDDADDQWDDRCDE